MKVRFRKYWNKNVVVFLVYTVFFSLTLSPGINGIGGFWDWSFPYYSEQLPNIFHNQSETWQLRGGGSPLSYSPDLYLRLLFIPIGWIGLAPEIVLYLFLVAMLTVTSYAVWKIIDKDGHSCGTAVIAIIATVNPLVVYKLLAGHFNFFPSLALFVLLIAYVNKHGILKWHNAVAVGLILAFVGLQIQFFLFAMIYLAVWAIFNRNNVSLRFVPIILFFVITIHLPWLINFITGANNAGSVSSRALEISRASSSMSTFISQFNLSFSGATHIDKMYPIIALIFFVLMWLLALTPLVLKKVHRSNNDVINLVCLVIFLALSTGFYMQIDGPTKFIAPMFREIGHFGPLVVLFASFLISKNITTSPKIKQLKTVTIALSIIFIGYNVYTLTKWLPTIDYSVARQKFREFKDFQTDKYDSRVLSYPFFGQYSFQGSESKEVRNFLLSNVGYDNFLKYSNHNYVENAIQSIDVQDSIQMQLLKTYDVSLLKPYNVRYLFDFSKIYESQYERYVPPSTYDGDVSLIKNNNNFFNILIERNPGKIKKVSENIYEIVDYNPIVSLQNIVDVKSNGDEGGILKFIGSELPRRTSYTLNSEDDRGYDVQPLFASKSDRGLAQVDGKLYYKDKLRVTSSARKIYIDKSQRLLKYKIIDDELILFTTTPEYAKVDNVDVPLQVTLEELTRTKIDIKNQYGIRVGESKDLYLIKKDVNEDIVMPISTDENVLVYEVDNNNKLMNGDFSYGLWQESTSDCGAYDDNPQIGMDLLSRDNGDKFLSLKSLRHNACTYVDINSTNEKSTYLLNYEYNSVMAQEASHALSSAGEVFDRGRIAINDSEWRQYSRIINNIPNGAPRLYLYSMQPFNRKPSIVNYDNVALKELHLITISQKIKHTHGYIDTEIKPLTSNSVVMMDIGNAQNLIKSDGFKRGLWKDMVDDCGNYDSSPDISMSLSENGGVNGLNALVLKSRRHTACTSTSVAVSSGEYNFSFSHNNSKKGMAAYAIRFDDPDQTVVNVDLPETKGEWRYESRTVKVPIGASRATLYVYAKEIDGKTLNTVKYSDFSIFKTSRAEGRNMIAESVDYKEVYSSVTMAYKSPTSRKIELTKVQGVHNLVLGESFNTNWTLTYGEDHEMVNRVGNVWKLNVKEICNKSMNNACHQNGDGSYTIKLTLYFAPQKLYLVSWWISAFVVLAAISIIVVKAEKRHKNL